MYFKVRTCGPALLLSVALFIPAAAQQETPAEQRQEQAADQMAQQNATHEPHMAAALKHLREAEEERTRRASRESYGSYEAG